MDTFADVIYKDMDYSRYKILLVDDEEDIVEFLSYNLSKEGFRIFTAYNGIEAVEKAEKEEPHLIILDVMMPEMDGIAALKEIRKIKKLNDTLIVLLTARSEDYSQILGFDAGADDYVTKPVKPKVLVKRVMALLRRLKQDDQQNEKLHIGGLVIDPLKYVVKKEGKEIALPKKVFELLYLLASKPEKVFTRDEIYSKVWGNDVVVGDRTIDVHIRKIREKLDLENIRTVKGVGYQLETS
jgi:two-component system alkaline phosphatase synthesis response regulator PhoP